MSTAQSPKDKENNKKKSNLKLLHNGVTSAWSFGHLKTWGDVYHKLGYTQTTIDTFPNRLETLTYIQLKEYLEKMRLELEERIKSELSLVNGQSIPTQQRQVVSVPVVSPVGESKIKRGSSSNNERVEEARVHDTSGKTDGREANANNYGLHPASTERAIRYWFQIKAIKELWDKIVVEKKSGVLLLSGTGTGKTPMTGGVLRRLLDANYQDEKTWSHIPYLMVTKSTVVEQITRQWKAWYNIDPIQDGVEIINIEQLRAKAGQIWVKESVKIEGGEEVSFWTWKKKIHPCVVFFDESQGAKNQSSTQSKIIYAYNDIPENACLVSISATPFTRVSEAKAFAVSTHRPLDHLGFPQGTVLNNDNWPTYAAQIADPASPEDYVEAAIERLMKDLEPWIVRVKGVKPQFEAENSIEKIAFQSPEAAEFYHAAWTRFQEEMAKLEKEVDEGRYRFVILLKFAMAAELCRADLLADRMYKAVQEGKAAVCAAKFKGTIIKAVQTLHDKYGVSRDMISLVWGGGQTQLTKKQKAKKKIKELDEKFKAMGSSAEEMLADMDLEDVEERELQELPEHLRLGQQTMEDRQVEIDKFQSGKSLYCFYTFRAGGVGLSLHHTDEFTTYKCRRKESGYALEEDIPNVPVRPRENFVAPTYSAIELVQGLGRCPRLTSLSPTKQTLLFYKGTIEEEIANIVSQKLRCLSKVVKMKESWQNVITGKQSVEEVIETTKDEPDDESGLLNEGAEE